MPRKQGSKTVSIRANWWDTDETVTIKAYQTHGIKKALERAVADCVTVVRNEEGENVTEVDTRKAMDAANELQLSLWIVAWTLKDENGTILPLTDAGIDSLVEEDIEFIVSEIDKRSTPQMTPEEQASFLATQPVGTVA